MSPFQWEGSTVLITGGTGSFGRRFVKMVLGRKPKKVIIFSRDELKQHEMRQLYPDDRPSSVIRYFIGDVRDAGRLRRAFHGVDLVVHAAALKQVPACEYNPFEAVQTNIMGAKNIIDASIDAGVRRVVALSTDKAVSPVNLYGATKLVAEKLFVQGNAYSGNTGARFSCVRYGNVVGSRGSVVPLFQQQKLTGELTITDDRMTRFWITLDQGVAFVANCAERMHGGEVFVPKIPSARLTDLARVIGPECKLKVTGIRPGEKLHEVLLSEDEARNALEFPDMFVVKPSFPWFAVNQWAGGKTLKDDFKYSSDNNTEWVNDAAMREMIAG